MTNHSKEKRNIFIKYSFNYFHSEKLRKLIDNENISIDRFSDLLRNKDSQWFDDDVFGA